LFKTYWTINSFSFETQIIYGLKWETVGLILEHIYRCFHFLFVSYMKSESRIVLAY